MRKKDEENRVRYICEHFLFFPPLIEKYYFRLYPFDLVVQPRPIPSDENMRLRGASIGRTAVPVSVGGIKIDLGDYYRGDVNERERKICRCRRWIGTNGSRATELESFGTNTKEILPETSYAARTWCMRSTREPKSQKHRVCNHWAVLQLAVAASESHSSGNSECRLIDLPNVDPAYTSIILYRRGLRLTNTESYYWRSTRSKSRSIRDRES